MHANQSSSSSSFSLRTDWAPKETTHHAPSADHRRAARPVGMRQLSGPAAATATAMAGGRRPRLPPPLIGRRAPANGRRPPPVGPAPPPPPIGRRRRRRRRRRRLLSRRLFSLRPGPLDDAPSGAPSSRLHRPRTRIISFFFFFFLFGATFSSISISSSSSSSSFFFLCLSLIISFLSLSFLSSYLNHFLLITVSSSWKHFVSFFLFVTIFLCFHLYVLSLFSVHHDVADLTRSASFHSSFFHVPSLFVFTEFVMIMSRIYCRCGTEFYWVSLEKKKVASLIPQCYRVSLVSR